MVDPRTQIDKQSSHTYATPPVGKHNQQSDAWIVLDGMVFDITQFLEYHPGGKEILLEHLGTDATDAFFTKQIHEHSPKAWKMLKQYRIGTLQNAPPPTYFSNSSEGIFSTEIDWKSPLVWQVWKMKPESYQSWLHASHTATNTLRLFETWYLEICSRWPWWVIFPLWLPIVMWAFKTGLEYTNSLALSLVLFFIGMMSWGGMEYVTHRFAFHVETESQLSNVYHFFAHGIHHLTPLDSSRLTFPPWFSMGLSALIMTTLKTFFYPHQGYHAWFGGLVLGYLFYDTMHYYFHHESIIPKIPVIGRYFNYMKSRHLDHHYKNPNKNYGVTNPVGDWIFGTSG